MEIDLHKHIINQTNDNFLIPMPAILFECSDNNGLAFWNEMTVKLGKWHFQFFLKEARTILITQIPLSKNKEVSIGKNVSRQSFKFPIKIQKKCLLNIGNVN